MTSKNKLCSSIAQVSIYVFFFTILHDDFINVSSYVVKKTIAVIIVKSGYDKSYCQLFKNEMMNYVHLYFGF